jgi:transposase
MLPKEYPPWQTVYYHFRRWRIDGRLHRAHDRLRDAVREAEGRERHPSAAVVDSQVVKTTPVGGPERGYDGAKRLAGRKRHLLVDTSGLVLAASVHSADLPDRDEGRPLLEEGGNLSSSPATVRPAGYVAFLGNAGRTPRRGGIRSCPGLNRPLGRALWHAPGRLLAA